MCEMCQMPSDDLEPFMAGLFFGWMNASKAGDVPADTAGKNLAAFAKKTFCPRHVLALFQFSQEHL